MLKHSSRWKMQLSGKLAKNTSAHKTWLKLQPATELPSLIVSESSVEVIDYFVAKHVDDTTFLKEFFTTPFTPPVYNVSSKPLANVVKFCISSTDPVISSETFITNLLSLPNIKPDLIKNILNDNPPEQLVPHMVAFLAKRDALRDYMIPNLMSYAATPAPSTLSVSNGTVLHSCLFYFMASGSWCNMLEFISSGSPGITSTDFSSMIHDELYRSDVVYENVCDLLKRLYSSNNPHITPVKNFTQLLHLVPPNLLPSLPETYLKCVSDIVFDMTNVRFNFVSALAAASVEEDFSSTENLLIEDIPFTSEGLVRVFSLYKKLLADHSPDRIDLLSSLVLKKFLPPSLWFSASIFSTEHVCLAAYSFGWSFDEVISWLPFDKLQEFSSNSLVFCGERFLLSQVESAFDSWFIQFFGLSEQVQQRFWFLLANGGQDVPVGVLLATAKTVDKV